MRFIIAALIVFMINVALYAEGSQDISATLC